ncbi:MAG: transcription elongation factor GreAB [Pseudomonadales bacterium]
MAQNKYDTLGLEAAYLAHGQSKRATEYQQELDEFKKIPSVVLAENQAIGPGCVVTLRFENTSRIVFIGPGAAGLKVQVDNVEIVVITPSAPLGKLLIGKTRFDVIETVINGVKTTYEISHCY